MLGFCLQAESFVKEVLIIHVPPLTFTVGTVSRHSRTRSLWRLTIHIDEWQFEAVYKCLNAVVERLCSCAAAVGRAPQWQHEPSLAVPRRAVGDSIGRPAGIESRRASKHRQSCAVGSPPRSSASGAPCRSNNTWLPTSEAPQGR